jgi:hypothetical protein
VLLKARLSSDTVKERSGSMSGETRDQKQPFEGGPEECRDQSSDRLRIGVIRKALTSESFVEKVALLLITVVLSGIIVPVLITYFNAQAAERQKESESRNARNEVILQAQKRLLDEFSDMLLTYETLALDVSWYRTKLGYDMTRYQKAYERYSDRTVELISK